MTSWEGVVLITTGGEVTDRPSGSSELVQSTLEISLEGVGLLISDPPLFILVKMVPGVLEVGIEVSWDLSWLKLVSSLEDGSGGDFTIVLHEEFLSSLVSGWSSSLLGESGEDVVHDLILVSTVVA